MGLGRMNPSSEWYEILAKFLLVTRPLVFAKAELWFQIINLQNSTTLHFYNCSYSWDEGTVTWNTAPSAGAYMGNISITTVGVYKLDITPFINATGLSVPFFTVRINSTESTWVHMGCKETDAAYSGTTEIPPQIRFDYEEVPSIGVDLFIMTFISISLGIIGTIMVSNKRKRLE